MHLKTCKQISHLIRTKPNIMKHLQRLQQNILKRRFKIQMIQTQNEIYCLSRIQRTVSTILYSIHRDIKKFFCHWCRNYLCHSKTNLFLSGLKDPDVPLSSLWLQHQTAKKTTCPFYQQAGRVLQHCLFLYPLPLSKFLFLFSKASKQNRTI